MRRLAIMVLGFSMAAASAHAQASHPSTYGTFAPNKSSPKPLGGGTFGRSLAPEPYRAHTPPPAPKSPGNTDGGQPFKPFKGSSTYSGPGAFKPAKPKSYFDR